MVNLLKKKNIILVLSCQPLPPFAKLPSVGRLRILPVPGLGPLAAVSMSFLQYPTTLLQCRPTQEGILQSRQELTAVKELLTGIFSLHELRSFLVWAVNTALHPGNFM